MTDDCTDACDEVFDGGNGEDIAEAAGCPGCCYVLGAAAAFGLMGMAEAIRMTDEEQRWARLEAHARALAVRVEAHLDQTSVADKETRR